MKEMTWEYAEDWQKKANNKKEYFTEPKWSFDCGFKLDFDGGILTVESRFYPPHKNISGLWEGNLNISILGKNLVSKEFKNDDLDKLKEDVESYIKHYSGIVKARLKP